VVVPWPATVAVAGRCSLELARSPSSCTDHRCPRASLVAAFRESRSDSVPVSTNRDVREDLGELPARPNQSRLQLVTKEDYHRVS